MDTDATQRFNRWSKTYEKSWMQWFYFDPTHSVVLAMAGKNNSPASILDVGCGTGRLLRRARTRWPDAQLIGVDAAEGMVEQARQMIPDATFMVSSAESLPLPDNSVDLAFSTISFHHWTNQLQGVQEIGRVLKKGGRFILADMTMPALLKRRFPHGHFCTEAEILALFGAAGFTIETQRRIFLRNVLVTSGVR